MPLAFRAWTARLMVAKRKDAIRIVENGRQRILRDDFTGKIETVNGALLKSLVGQGLYPGDLAAGDLAGRREALNVDADRAAAYVAGAVGAEQLVILTNVPGLLRHFPDESTLITNLPKAGLEQALSFAEGRMKKKVLGASEALDLGVAKVVFADGRIEIPCRRSGWQRDGNFIIENGEQRAENSKKIENREPFFLCAPCGKTF